MFKTKKRISFQPWLDHVLILQGLYLILFYSCIHFHSFENDDLTTLKIKEYNSKTFIIEDDIEDKCLEK